MNIQFEKNIIASSHINFLFGAGVNGKAFPQLEGFEKTIFELKKRIDDKYCGFEDSINLLDQDGQQYVYNVFKEEFKSFSVDYENRSLVHLGQMLSEIYNIVESTENRQRDMKQINIYTLNYDCIVEEILSYSGYLNNVISASNLGTNIKFLDIVGYDYAVRKFIPSFMISKLHGDIENPIFPGKNKFEASLQADYFEINYRMKQQLCKYNSILIVIGYSCNDEHINKILYDCIKHGLVIYWFKFSETDKVLQNVPENQLIVFEQNDYKNPIDTTYICYEKLREINE